MEDNEQELPIELIENILVQAVRADGDATNYPAYFAVLAPPSPALCAVAEYRLKNELNFVLHAAITQPHRALLDLWRYLDLPVRAVITSPLISDLCRDGHADVLEWIVRASGPLWHYTVHAMNFASMNGHVNVLEWWRTSGNPPMYSQLAFTGAAKNGHVAALQWWRDSGLHVGGFTDKIMDVASEFGQVAVLEWMLRESGWPVEYSTAAVDA
ncbi:hypothetical protein H9P43_003744, partial [Blastocladiella emersonii ATCC 22665]